jgi:hypothetical protein
MGFEPITYCAFCHEPSDLYQPGFWLCEGCAENEIEESKRAQSEWHEMWSRPFHKPELL